MPKGIYNRTKPSWNKGLTKLDPRVAKSIENRSNNLKWKENQKERMRKLGKSRKGLPSNRKGCKLTKEQKQKSGVKPINWSDRCKQTYIKHPELKIIRSIQRLNQILPIKDTKIEKKLQNELKKRHIIFKTHPNIDNISQPDILIPKYNTIIFADGCYWHNCPLHGNGYNPSPYDNGQIKLLELRGYKVFRFWEHEINESPEKCIDLVLGVNHND
jgi:DNA mismatch endonuclease (patch repair protein)